MLKLEMPGLAHTLGGGTCPLLNRKEQEYVGWGGNRMWGEGLGEEEGGREERKGGKTEWDGKK